MFSDTDVLQGRVATRIRCDGIFNNSFNANFLQNLSVMFFEKWLSGDEVIPTSLVSPILWDTVYIVCTNNYASLLQV